MAAIPATTARTTQLHYLEAEIKARQSDLETLVRARDLLFGSAQHRPARGRIRVAGKETTISQAVEKILVEANAPMDVDQLVTELAGVSRYRSRTRISPIS